ncbi:MAG TPA: hypothetical protein VMI13_11835 [Solirubrobacteraceae bacterium]|nr:hypothetical protein [Solirubrobacteraceae bacterium]
MARVVVTDDSGNRILLDERVLKVHLVDRHSSMQMIERLVWAVEDADDGREPRQVARVPQRRSLQAA